MSGPGGPSVDANDAELTKLEPMACWPPREVRGAHSRRSLSARLSRCSSSDGDGVGRVSTEYKWSSALRCSPDGTQVLTGMAACGVRLSEKTIELNFCTRLAPLLTPPFWWWGLTQRQEAQLGWDAAAMVGGHWVLFQIKASSHVLANGTRRFRAQHDQLTALRWQAFHPNAVFYVLPMVGTDADLAAANFDLVPNLRFLDVHELPAGMPSPTTTAGAPRANRLHYVDLDASATSVTIHSDPIDAPVLRLDQVAGRLAEVDRGQPPQDRSRIADDVGVARSFLRAGRNRVALLLAPLP